MLKGSCLLLTLLSLTSWGQKTPAEWKLFDHNNFSIQYPPNWDLDKTGYQGTTFLLASELTSIEDPFRENVDLIIQDLRGTTIYLNKYVKMSEEKLGTFLTNFTILESTRIKDHRGEFHKLIFTGETEKFPGGQENQKLKFEQYIWVKGVRAYILTFHADLNQFDNYKETGEKIMNSFKIK